MGRVFIVLVLLGILAVPLQFGGYAWLGICLVALLVQLLSPLWTVSHLAGIVPAFLWVAVFSVTDDREMFFPYVIYLSSHTALIFAGQNVWLATLSGLSVVAAFLAVRIFQSAPVPVLILEFGIALAILEAGIIAFLAARKGRVSQMLISGIASLLALASLLI